MAKLKTLTFEEQLAAMSEKHGIPTEDAVNVFSAYRKTLDELVGAEADAGTKAFEVVTPFGCYSALWVESEKRTNSADGVEYESFTLALSHYGGRG